MEKEIELLNETEAALLRLMVQYQSGQYVALGECISNVRAVRENFCRQAKHAVDNNHVHNFHPFPHGHPLEICDCGEYR